MVANGSLARLMRTLAILAALCCTFFTEARNLAYEPLGALVRECIR